MRPARNPKSWKLYCFLRKELSLPLFQADVANFFAIKGASYPQFKTHLRDLKEILKIPRSAGIVEFRRIILE